MVDIIDIKMLHLRNYISIEDSEDPKKLTNHINISVSNKEKLLSWQY
mgnify:CR=1 FL=1